MIVASVIFSFVSGIMIMIGISQMRKKDDPVGFENLIDPPKRDEISDVIQWNKKHGMIWITYGICIELGFWLGYLVPTEALKMIVVLGGVIIPLPFMVIRHKSLEVKYRRN